MSAYKLFTLEYDSEYKVAAYGENGVIFLTRLYLVKLIKKNKPEAAAVL